ncbi:DUF3618 domain-containing protein [Lichenibacterium ramalinae]|uniref:DUF3618 domain-containing protein n=1 Tax=Lichenibacterium ramalinae TaxID=2316527 RepID=A0A4Q2RH12_9HYPH|nr:DUF3618 domain-containing protein [Lichenibacterium ramalinae]RYB06952.1 DUF3618 domain-containing protein [Lichenibacterium ramalinae]
MSGDIGRQSSSEVAHEAEDTRAHLASTLEQLRNNLRPENVMEEVVSNARVGASTVADNVLAVAKQYPIPAALIAAGSALILRAFTKSSDAPKASDAAAMRGVGPRPIAPIPSAPPLARPPQLRNPSTFQPAPGRAAGDDRRPAATLATGGAALQRQAADAYSSTTSQAGDAMQNLSRYLPHDRREVKSKLSNLLEEQPLILGAIGLAVGAAIGAALPMTETEDSLMGSTAHRLRDTAADAARHEFDGLRAVAGEAVDNVRHSASDNLHGFVKDVGDQAKTVVGKAGETLSPGSRDV